MGVTSISAMELESLAKKFLEKHSREVLVVSMGAKGALWANRKEITHIPAPTIHQKSTIDAGDSMVAGMMFSLQKGKSLVRQ